MKSDVQEALVTMYRTMEKLRDGRAPSNGLVFSTVRALGFKFDDGEAKTMLAKFRDAARPKVYPGGTPDAPLAHSASTPEIEHDYPADTPASPQSHPTSTGATRALTKELPSSQSLFGDGTPVPSPPDKPSPRAPRPEHALRDALGELIRPHLTSMTITGWKNVNGKFALDMAQAGVTVAEAVEVWQSEHERTGYPIIKLQTLQERINTARSRRELAASPRGANASAVQTIPKDQRR